MRWFLQFAIKLVPWRLRGVICKLPIIAQLQRWIIARYLSDRQFIHIIDAGPAKGLAYPVILPLDKAIWIGNYEVEFASSIANSLTKGMVCFDIGGYRGFIAGMMAVAGAGRVVTFEPLEENREQIQRMIEVNPGIHVEIMPVAINDCDEETKFKVMPNPSMGKLVSSDFQPQASEVKTIPITVCKLDSLVLNGGLPVPDIMKVDVEGAETAVLQGATKLLTKHAPILFIEAHSGSLAQECADFLYGLGYDVTVVETRGSIDTLGNREISHLVARKVNNAETQRKKEALPEQRSHGVE